MARGIICFLVFTGLPFMARCQVTQSDTIHKTSIPGYNIAEDSFKKHFSLHTSIPYVNNFLLQPEGESRKATTGFFGAGVGLDYHYTAHRFFGVTATAVMEFEPIPFPYELSGEVENYYSIFLVLSHNHHIGRLTAGYGVSFASHAWELRYHDRNDAPPPTRAPVKKRHSALGLAFPVYFRVWLELHVGFVYRPTLVRPGITPENTYEHTISLELAGKFKFR